MAKKCDLCNRSSMRGAMRSHSKRRTLKRQDINLQARNVGGIKIKLCTSCLRTIDKKPRVKKARQPKKKA
jgi:ribosomal protein L28